MIKYNSNNINDWDFGTSNIVKVYHNNAVCYYKVVAGETAQTPCYAVVDDITQYQDTEFENIYNKADKAHYARIAKKKMTKAEFEAWSRYAVELREQAERNEISFEEYVRTIKK